MTNKNKKRPSGYRAPGRAEPVRREEAPRPQRRGILDSVFAPRVPGTSSMPRIRTSLARGLATAAGTPALVVVPIGIVFVEWLAVLALGYQGPFAVFVNALALPPVGTSFDATLATSVYGLQGGLFAILGFVAVRALVMAVLTGLTVDALEGSGVSRWSMVRALRTLPVTLAVSLAGMAFLTLASFLGPLLGAGFGVLIQVGALVAGVYLFAFAPVIAASEGRSMPESLSRSVRAARIPGAGNLTMAAVYVISAVAVLVAPGKPGSVIGVTPTIGAWALVLISAFLHVVVFATFVYRYLCVAGDVPEAAAARQRAGRR